MWKQQELWWLKKARLIRGERGREEKGREEESTYDRHEASGSQTLGDAVVR